ncbi:peptidoglycan DD-metalloendopeptidase family protein [Tychonema sp. BBK16]|uniref:peptidoglycan DD-metalloendopeptidase family protein n=1 Tax=Tychonema sp. BBK16 TaxID=2699888 RepID=UPI001F2F68F5|nr:peptidoglycan DD-metalloendopeptidase family protein [Tychonema sp. BBK16]MCF6371945.1 peptidoglycan DD-metalloendopeptidase family protein [Tychonema sp. BBK16]
MKRIYPKKNQPVKASEIDRDGSKEQSKQTTLSTGRVRSLATIGLAISVGASSILLTRTDSARASELSSTEPTAEVQPASASELATSLGDASSATPTAEPSNPVAVKVQPGQTLWELSQDYALAPNALATANGIESDTLLQVGQKLTIPPTEVVASSQQNGGNTPIAAPPEYAAVVNPEQKLDITGSAPSSSPVTQSGPQSTAANPIPTLTPEQNLLVAPNTNGAIDSLKKQENRTAEFGQTQLGSELTTSLSTSALSLQSPAPTQASSTSAKLPVIPNAGFGQTAPPIEQSLVTPSLPTDVVVPSAGTTPVLTDVAYTVRPGDTLSAIASSQGVKAQDLISINKLGNPNLLNVNQRLKIPQVGVNNPAVQASASIQASNSTSVFSAVAVPGSLNPSSSTPEIPGSGVTVSAPTVPIVSPLANLEGLNNISAPMVPQINNISLTQVSQSISDPRKLEIPDEPTFTGAVDTSALPMPAATATASSNLTAAYPQPANWTPVVSTQGLATDVANAVPESSAATQSAEALSPYAERLRAEVVRLRSEYRAERNAIGPNSVALTPTADPETQVAAGNPSEDNEHLNPYLYTPEYGGTVQNEISRPPSRGWSEQVQKQQQERLDAARAAQSQPINLTPASNLDRPVVATAPFGAQGYDPLSHPSLGQMVSPELPPLSGADTYLPKGSKQQSVNSFVWPAKGVFTSGYGWRWGRMHRGIDIAGPIGTPIVAASDGVVTYAQWNDGGYGYLVEITHPDGTETVYAHNNRILVQKGQRVAQGEQISEMGSTGFSTGPHLHFEIHPPGSGAVNPMAFLPKDDSSASR